MEGDRIDTNDITGWESDLSTVLVLSGISTKEALKDYAYRLSVLLDGISNIPRLAAEAMQKGQDQVSHAVTTEEPGKKAVKA